MGVDCHHTESAQPGLAGAALASAVAAAASKCERTRERLTPPRRRVLELLLEADGPMKAYDLIASIGAEPEEGKIYKGKVVKIVDFGAFVNFFGKRDGLVHVSQIENRRLNHPSDVLKEGQEVWVKLLGFDDRGKVRLAMKMVDQETGKELEKQAEDAAD